ncbi:MAG: hypothetical protein PVJ32_04715, partial [Anaerolineales bacterium]
MEAEIDGVESGTVLSGGPNAGEPAEAGQQPPMQPPEEPRKLWPWLLGGGALFICCAAVVV